MVGGPAVFAWAPLTLPFAGHVCELVGRCVVVLLTFSEETCRPRGVKVVRPGLGGCPIGQDCAGIDDLPAPRRLGRCGPADNYPPTARRAGGRVCDGLPAVAVPTRPDPPSQETSGRRLETKNRTVVRGTAGAVHVDMPASRASPAVAGCAWLCDPAPGWWFSVRLDLFVALSASERGSAVGVGYEVNIAAGAGFDLCGTMRSAAGLPRGSDGLACPALARLSF